MVIKVSRRTFLTLAERLAISYATLKELTNHSAAIDTTFGCLVVDVERLREPMQRITAIRNRKNITSLFCLQQCRAIIVSLPQSIARKHPLV